MRVGFEKTCRLSAKFQTSAIYGLSYTSVCTYKYINYMRHQSNTPGIVKVSANKKGMAPKIEIIMEQCTHFDSSRSHLVEEFLKC